jgi:hypothetical protein
MYHVLRVNERGDLTDNHILFSSASESEAYNWAEAHADEYPYGVDVIESSTYVRSLLAHPLEAAAQPSCEVFVVVSGGEGDCHVQGVFSTRELAQGYVDAFMGYAEILEYTLDKP